MKNAISFLTLVALLSVAQAVHGDHNPVIFSQDPLLNPPGGVPVAVISQHDTSVGGFGEIGRAYDNFWFNNGIGATVTDIHWRGAYDMDPNPNSFVDEFELTIWADDGGQPGTGGGDILFTDVVQATETFISQEAGLGGTVWVYDYDADFSVPFAADPATDYWVSIMARLSTPSDDDPFHGWFFAVANAGDGKFVQDFDTETFLGADDFDGVVDPGEGRLIADGDLAFRLTGITIPEPSSVGVWLVLATALGLGMTVRRRYNRAN